MIELLIVAIALAVLVIGVSVHERIQRSLRASRCDRRTQRFLRDRIGHPCGW